MRDTSPLARVMLPGQQQQRCHIFRSDLIQMLLEVVTVGTVVFALLKQLLVLHVPQSSDFNTPLLSTVAHIPY